MPKFTEIKFVPSTLKVKITWEDSSTNVYDLTTGLKLEFSGNDEVTATEVGLTNYKPLVRVHYTSNSSAGVNGKLIFGAISYDCNSESNVHVRGVRAIFEVADSYTLLSIGSDDIRALPTLNPPNFVVDLNDETVYLQLIEIDTNDYDMLIAYL